MYWKLLFTLIKTLTLNLPVPFLGLPTVTTGILIQVNLGIYWHGSCTTKWMSSRYVREIIIYIGNTYFHGNLLNLLPWQLCHEVVAYYLHATHVLS